jgi:hypothetical protein
MAGLRFAELQSRPMEFLDFTSVTLDEFQHWPRPSKRYSKPGWRRGGWMGSREPRVGLPWTKTARCRRRKTDCSSSSPTSRLILVVRKNSLLIMLDAILPRCDNIQE